MEIRVEQRMTGQEVLDSILKEYGTLEKLADLSGRSRNIEAQDALFTVGLLRASPQRLKTIWKTIDIGTLTTSHIEQLTPKRLLLLEHIQSARQSVTRVA